MTCNPSYPSLEEIGERNVLPKRMTSTMDEAAKEAETVF